MPLTLQDIVLPEDTRSALYLNGKVDATSGMSPHTGWKEVAKLCGFDPTRRTPAQEAYLDGYYSVTRK